jgi:outer membrane protein assembly factor BamB
MSWGVGGGLVALVAASLGGAPGIARAATVNWPEYMNGNGGYNPAETVITPATASKLTLKFNIHPGGSIFSQPVEANGLVYVGTYYGTEMALNPTTGASVWKATVGKTQDLCSSQQIGVVGTAAVTTVTLGGTATSVLLVGGGNAQLYALNALTGAIIWHTALGGQMNWASPIVASVVLPGTTSPTTVAYMGTASFCDTPLIQGKLIQLNVATGAIINSFNVVPNGCIGGAVWGSATVDTSVSPPTVYIASGNPPGPNHNPCKQPLPYAPAVIELNAASLGFIGAWQVPAAQQTVDADFGNTPVLFTATIAGTATALVGALNKNGIFYAFKRGAVSSGPVWQTRISVGGQEPQKGIGSVAPAAFDGTTLYAAGGNTTIKGASCQGSVQALNPATGVAGWQKCLTAAVLGAVTIVPGVGVVGNGPFITVFATATGATLFTYKDTTNNARFYGPASIVNGRLYEGNMDGRLYSFG